MQDNGRDPLDWSVEEVVEFLCNNPQTPWSQSTARLPRPNPEFKSLLRENLITGEVLLQDVDKQVLRDDLKLKALGHRSSIMMAIRYLQQRSAKFQQTNVGNTEQVYALPSPSPMQFPPHHHPTAYPSPIYQAASIPSYNSIVQAVHPTTPLLNNPITIADSDTPMVADDTTNMAQPGSTSTQVSPKNVKSTHIHRQEQLVIDKYGNKRRRLNLNASLDAPSLSKEPSTRKSSNDEITNWYMGPDALTPSQLFYPSESEADNTTFTLLPSRLPTGQRKFVNKRLRYFFQQPPIQLESDQNHIQQAIVPYPSSLMNSHKDRYFTLYTANQEKVNVRKENISNWPQLTRRLNSNIRDEGQISSEDLKPSDPLSYLLDKYPVQEDLGDAYPVYGDSGSEGEFDEITWKEIEEERNEPTPLQKAKLSRVEIRSIIQDCIIEYEKSWSETRQAKEECKARSIWLAARQGNRVNQEIKALGKDITLLEKRLHKLQDELLKVEFSTPAEVRTQCQCLEHTVLHIQKQKWRISVLQQDKCPPKSVPTPRSRQPKRIVADEDSLESESDFIEDDIPDHPIIDYNETYDAQVESHPWSSSSSDGDDDVISVSGTRRRTRGQPPKIFASSSSSADSPPPPLLPGDLDVIDLTMESPQPSEPEDYTIETPLLNPVGANKSNVPTPSMPEVDSSMSPLPSLSSLSDTHVKAEGRRYSPLPEIDNMKEILSTEWELIEERQDRRRLLAKLIGSLSDKERKDLSDYIPEYQFSKLKSLTGQGLRALIKGHRKFSKLNDLEIDLIMRTVSLYVSWVNCAHLDNKGIRKKLVIAALEDLDGDGFGKYYEELINRLRSSRAWKRTEAASPERELDSQNTPHKKRKREVKESQSAKMTQANAQRRVARQERQRSLLEKQLGVHVGGLDNQPVSFKEPVIYLDPHIGSRVKPHQLKGIQFMWRELVEDKNQQGCLLAHTMGLGKTMQVISLLTTISAAAASSDIKIRDQVPKRLRRSQTLIICPASLIDNWQDEFAIWAPNDPSIGTLRVISTSDNFGTRLEELSDWHTEGGVLLISYTVFRIWVNNKETPKRPKPLSDTEHERVKNCLLDSPNIIIADEAHMMKNPTAAISMAAARFRSKSRIALTGSPIANNLGEYFTMVDWIANDYLGTYVEFKAHYVEPIEEGLYADSTHAEKRQSLVKLQVLKKILEPKINRADITVVEGSLPPKVEFVLTVPLTFIQKAAYDTYVAFVPAGATDVGQTKLWSWLGILGLCCQHPSCFIEKLSSRAKSTSASSEDEQAIPGDEHITQAGIPELDQLVAKQNELFSELPNVKAVELSARAEIVKRIVDESITAGDKLLIFSQSLLTLDYLEHMLNTSGWKFLRLDGKTPISSRQAATKGFNTGQGTQVYLISTRAGGLGLNIPGANRVIIFDFSFNPVWEEQAVGRAYRLGQQKPVFVYRFVAGGTFEEIIHHKAIFKTQLSVRVVDKKNPIRFAQKKPGDYLFPAKLVSAKDISEYIGKDKLVLDKLLLDEEKKEPENRLIRGITLTQTFHKEDNDKLTEEEHKSVQEELHLENLKHTDPEAYAKKMNERAHERYMQQMQLLRPQQYQHQQQATTTASLPVIEAHGPYPTTIPQTAHNSGPPALAPDITHHQAPYHSSNAMPRFASQPHIGVPTRNQLGQNYIHPQAQIHSSQRVASQSDHPENASIPGLGLIQPDALSVAHHHHPPAAASNIGSEPLKPNSPAVDAIRQEMASEQLEVPHRGQSAPLGLEDPFIQTYHSPQPSAEEESSKDAGNGGCRNQ
ncbi:hypothetical protein BJX70DRAFT_240042 [Aspergillus crustosus]